MSECPLEHSIVTLQSVHGTDQCRGRACPVHNRSNHQMRGFQQVWDQDKRMIMRVCSHGVRHPDPDNYPFLVERLGTVEAAHKLIHGCDGCGHRTEGAQPFLGMAEFLIRTDNMSWLN